MSGALFGSPGKMIEFFPWEENQSVAHHRSLNIHETIGGGSYAFRGPKTRRSWSLKNSDMSPEEYRDLELLLYDGGGIGPFWLIDQEARATNALTPVQSLLRDDSQIGGAVAPTAPVRLPGGFDAPAVVSTSTTTYLRFNVPTIPDQPMTLSFYGTSGGTSRVQYMNADGSLLADGGGLAQESGNNITRYHRTVTPGSGAAMVRLRIDNVDIISAPAISYTSELRPWSVGKGCDQAVLSSWTRDFDRMSSINPDRQLASVSLKIEEVGPGA